MDDLAGPGPSYSPPFASITTILLIVIGLFTPALLVITLLLYLVNPETFEFIPGTMSVEVAFNVPVIFLALWSFLRQPIVMIRQHGMERLSNQYPDKAHQIAQWLSTSRAGHHVRLLRIPELNPDIFVFGTWRHHYLAISDGALGLWSDAEELRAVIQHELAHIENGDSWKATLARVYTQWALFPVLFLFMVRLVGLDGYSGFNGLLGMLLVTLPILLTVGILVLAVRLIYRMREFIADTTAANALGSDRTLTAALIEYQLSKRFPAGVKQPLTFITEGDHNPFTRMFNFHPTATLRIKILQDRNLLVSEVPALAMLAGLIIGAIAAYGASGFTSSWELLVCSILFGPIISALIVAQFNMLIQTQTLQLVIITVTAVCVGMTIAYLFNFPATLFWDNYDEATVYLRTESDIRFILALVLDNLVLLLVAQPIALMVLTGLVLSITHFMSRKLGRYSLGTILAVWLVLLPSLVLAAWQVLHWGWGFDVHFPNNWLQMMVGWLIWAIVVTSIHWLWIQRQLKQATRSYEVRGGLP